MVLVTDLDGTLARRHEPVSAEMARSLATILPSLRGLAIISGQCAENVRQRVVTAVGSEGVNRIWIYSCEGACRWTTTKTGIEKDRAYSLGREYSKLEQAKLQGAVERFLGSAEERGMIAETSRPEWWDDAMMVFKTRRTAASRTALARALRNYLTRDFNDRATRVGVAGETTVSICRAGLDKATALWDITTRAGGEEIIYIGDEFAATGNDAPALRVPGVSVVSVGNLGTKGNGRIFHAGLGPEGTVEFLRFIHTTKLLQRHQHFEPR